MIFLVGPLPPPVHGAALVTERVAELLRANNTHVSLCNISPAPGAVGARYHISRLRAYVRCWQLILTHRGVKASRITYVSLSGGLGQFYDFIVVLVSRW